MKLAVSVSELRKDYVLSGETIHALRGVSFDVPEGDYISIMGPSGSGKSTLLNLLGCLDRPTSGSFLLGGEDVARMSDDHLSATREEILDLLASLNAEGRTIIMVTHENEVADHTARTIMLRDGIIQFDERR